MTEIWIGSKDNVFRHPEAWAEVPAKALLPTLNVAYTEGRTPAARLSVLRLLSPIPVKLLRKLDAGQIHELCLTLDWVFTKPIEEQPFESFEHRGVTYYLPSPEWQHSSYSEMQSAQAYFFQLMYDEDTPQLKSAAKLVATLCRPKRKNLDEQDPAWDGDYREPFNEHAVERRHKELLDLPPGIMVAIMHYFNAQLKWLVETYDVYESGNPDAEPSEFDWVSALMAIKDSHFYVAETGVLGNYHDVANANVNEVYWLLEREKEKLKQRRMAAPEA